MSGSADTDPSFSLLSVGHAVNRTETRSAVADLVAAAGLAPGSMAAPDEFLAQWEAFEAGLKGAWGSPESLQQLEDLLAALPVAHVDLDSPRRLSVDGALLERCAFRKVAASVVANFPEAAGALADARAALSSPLVDAEAQGVGRFATIVGESDDVDVFVAWFDDGQKPEDVPQPPQPDDPSNPAFHDWLEMMAEEHACDDEGNPSHWEDDPDEDVDSTTTSADKEADEEDDDVSLIATDQSGVNNKGSACWGPCGAKQGKCSYCGSEGYCCRFGWHDKFGGCTGRMGLSGKGHVCTDPPDPSDTPPPTPAPTPGPKPVSSLPRGQVDGCYKDWQDSAVAARLLEFLERELR